MSADRRQDPPARPNGPEGSGRRPVMSPYLVVHHVMRLLAAEGLPVRLSGFGNMKLAKDGAVDILLAFGIEPDEDYDDAPGVAPVAPSGPGEPLGGVIRDEVEVDLLGPDDAPVMPECLCGRPATCTVRIHYELRWTRDVCSSVAGPPQYACAKCAGGVVANHGHPGETPITVTITPLGGDGR
jgi:hypothetical protein